MKKGLLFIAALAVVFLMGTPVFAEGKIEVSDITAKQTHDADYMRYVRYEVEAEVKNHTNEEQEVAVTIRGVSDRGGGGTGYLYGRIPAKSSKYLSFNGRMLLEDWKTIQEWEVVDVTAH
ncbi:hypothetical protein ACFL4N_04730 [Thermodesulfobacteriota bacterium]